jgi:outer membrane receptor for ferrienterochelin and colicin
MKKIFVLLLLTTGSLLVFGQTYSSQKKLTSQEKLNEKYCSALFKNADGTILEVSDNQSAQSYPNILDWLEGRVAGLQVYTSRSAVKLPYIRGSQAKIYIDEMAVDANYLNSLPVSDIAMIKVIKGTAASVFGATGVIAIYTIKDEDEEGD